MAQPSVNLEHLRDFGWTHWDPIGLARIRDECEDEYDDYLLEVAAMLSMGSSSSAAADYLALIEADHMGLGSRPSAMPRAQATVNAIASYLAGLRNP